MRGWPEWGGQTLVSASLSGDDVLLESGLQQSDTQKSLLYAQGEKGAKEDEEGEEGGEDL